jgi:hypothetical protein
MTFLFPLGLLMLVPVALMAVAYVAAMRRRQRYAVRYAALPLLDKVIPERPQWRRHLPGVLLLATLGLVGLAVARPEMPVRVPYERATIIASNLQRRRGHLLGLDRGCPRPGHRPRCCAGQPAIRQHECPDGDRRGRVHLPGTDPLGHRCGR